MFWRTSGEQICGLRIDLSESELGKAVFTNLDKIKGRIVFTPESNVLVSEVIIDFVGIEKVYGEHPNPGIPHVSLARQVTTRMTQ
jgi:hypothetical protein